MSTPAQHRNGEGIAPEDPGQAIRRLAAASSGSEDLLTLYIPPDRTVAEVREYLEREYERRHPGTGTGRGPAGAPSISRALALLRTGGQIPENGLAIFCGPGGTGPAECGQIVPPSRIRDFLLRISTRFDVEPLARMRKEDDTWGLILLDLEQAYWAILRGGEPGEIGRISANVPAKHHKGGQSAARFQRLRAIAAHGFYTRVGEHAGAGLLAGTGGGRLLAGVLIGGRRASALELAEGPFLPAAIRQKILGTVEVEAISAEGLRALAKRAGEMIRERKAGEVLRELEAFFGERARDPGLAVYGEEVVRELLGSGAVKTLLLSSSLRKSGAEITCHICGHASERTIRLGEGETVPAILAHTCRACDAPLIEDAAVDLIGDLGALALRSGAGTMVVPADSEEGQRFFRETGGVGAILRFRPEE
jgi:peptide chain release factor subunit 1